MSYITTTEDFVQEPWNTPAGGENPQGFHPFANLSPILAEESAAGRQNTVTMPVRGEMN
ncbi:MAG: hypothetical protein LBK61_14155 [Spirochaetaceae bacterium]|jgi:hypothetical protein|nr:hypothetical protein [Spirochaetaceae bacterium]